MQRSVTGIKLFKHRTLYANGFTLVEMLIAISIMGLILSLVGPLTLKVIDRAQAQSELISFKNNLKKVSYVAFVSSTEHTFVFEDNNAIIFKADKKYAKISFKHLLFTPQELTFNSRGYPSPEILEFNSANKTVSLNVFRLIEGANEKK
jgi:prepilin-type N-terminal cleavage/methylation domain-containing protein